MPSVLFVCTGNTCRSPMAQALFLGRLKEAGEDLSTWQVASAGTWAQDGSSAARNAKEVVAKRGLDLSGHRSRTVTGDILSGFNLVLAMEASHKEALVAEFPNLSKRIFMLSEMVGKKLSIEDPIGGEFMDYKQCADEIDSIFQRGWQRILTLAAGPSQQ